MNMQISEESESDLPMINKHKKDYMKRLHKYKNKKKYLANEHSSSNISGVKNHGLSKMVKLRPSKYKY